MNIKMVKLVHVIALLVDVVTGNIHDMRIYR